MCKQRLAAVCAVATLSLMATPAIADVVASGLDSGASYTQDYWQNINGGLQQGNGAPGLLDLYATVDGRIWGGSQNDVLHINVLGITGSSISNRVGDLQTLDNIEAHDTVTVFEAWYQHNFQASGIKLRGGLLDYNAQFNSLGSAGVFLNSSFGLDPTIAQAPVPTYAVSTLGATLRWDGASGVYVLAGVYDGTPGLPGHPNGTHVDFSSDAGVLSAVEIGLTGGGSKPYKLAVGGWYNTRTYQDLADNTRDRNHGEYLIGERRLLGDDEHLPMVDAFFQLGHADTQRNPLDGYIGGGLNVTGLWAARPQDVLGLAVASAHTSKLFRRTTATARPAETSVELTYSLPVNAHLNIQPDVQYIFNPGADASVDHALVFGVRVVLAL